MKRFDRILSDIRKIKIQGAEHIAMYGIRAFMIQPDKVSAEKILSTRPTEPLLQNSIKILLKSKNKKKDSKKILNYIKKSNDKMTRFGASLIKNNYNVFTHCHSSTVMSILKKAKKNSKKFVVYNTETAPLYQGRTTAKELAKSGIKVVHVPDLAAEYLIKKCDLFLFGADAFTKKGPVNKLGTKMLCELAKKHQIPRYTCGASLKFTKKVKLEFRKGKEVWDEREKNITIINPAFDLVPEGLVSGVVSEFGILHYNAFIKKAKQNLKRFL